MKFTNTLILGLFFPICSFAQSKIFVDTTISPIVMVTDFFNSPKVQVSNVQFSGSTLGCGYFDASQTNLGLKAGIALTTGLLSELPLPPSYQAEMDLAGASFADPDLQQITSIPVDQHDVAVLTFDLVSSVDSLCFIYRFGSEEYPEYGCTQYNDIFAFFVEGPNYVPKQNIALIPAGSEPVAINNLHPQNPDDNTCIPKNEHLYENQIGTNGPIVYDGLTKTLEAKFIAVPGAIYRIKLAISDLGDPIFDSGVLVSVASLGHNFDVTPVAELSAPVITGSSVQFKNTSRYGTSWHWDFGDGDTSNLRYPPAHQYNLPPSGVANYEAKLIASNYCCSDTVVMPIQFGSSSVQELDYELLSCYPNPASTVAYFQLKSTATTNTRLDIFGIDGKLIEKITIPVGSSIAQWNCANLPKGVYRAQLMEQNSLLARVRVVRN
jgi:Secretion system C-terminal sorting domain